MDQCKNCQSNIILNAYFCHECGNEVAVLTKAKFCNSCTHENPAEAKYCFHCGYVIESGASYNMQHYRAEYPLDFLETSRLPFQIKSYFFKTLKKSVENDIDLGEFEDYVDRFYESDFKNDFEIEALQIAEEAYTIHSHQRPTQDKEIDLLLKKVFNLLINRFIIMHAEDLGNRSMSPAVLEYTDVPRRQLDVNQMITDFLDVKNEEGIWYEGVDKMSETTLENAQSKWLFLGNNEECILLFDSSVFGSCKEGFALTDKCIYWKDHFSEPLQISYNQIRKVEKTSKGISINNAIFNFNPSVNSKIAELLKRFL